MACKTGHGLSLSTDKLLSADESTALFVGGSASRDILGRSLPVHSAVHFTPVRQPVESTQHWLSDAVTWPSRRRADRQCRRSSLFHWHPILAASAATTRSGPSRGTSPSLQSLTRKCLTHFLRAISACLGGRVKHRRRQAGGRSTSLPGRGQGSDTPIARTSLGGALRASGHDDVRRVHET